MNIQYNLTETGGFPLDQGVLNDIQDGILEAEAALASLLGPLAIISGCVVTGSVASSGVVAIRGQILPFVGGAIGAKVIIVETDNDLTYFNGSIYPANITRVAQFGDDGVQNNPWADFVSVTSVGVIADINTLNAEVATLNTEAATLNTEVATLNTEMATTVKKLASGTHSFSANITSDTLVTISIGGSALANNNYMVIMQLLSLTAGSPAPNDNDLIAVVRNKTTTTFDIWIGPPTVGVATNQIGVDWIIVSF